MMSVTLTGGSPWGFKMIGGKDFHLPLTIAKVSPGGKADKLGIPEGYILQRVNGKDVSCMSHHEAQILIKCAKSYLHLHISKPEARKFTKPLDTLSQLQRNQTDESFFRNSYESTRNFQTYGEEPKQSPSHYIKTKPAKAEVKNRNKPTLIISQDIKRMIFDSDNYDQSAKEITGEPVTRCQPTEHKSNLQRIWSKLNHKNETRLFQKNKAVGNIGKFIENSRCGKHVFAKVLHDQVGTFYEPLVLEVRLAANLTLPSVHWYHNDAPLRESRDRDVSILSNGLVHTVVLGDLRDELLGTYTCTVISKHGSQSCHCDVAAAKHEHHHVSSSMDSSSALSASSVSRRVAVDSSADLISSRTTRAPCYDQIGNTTTIPRCSLERSEVAKVLWDDPPPFLQRKSPSMKLIEESLDPESIDL